MTYFVVKGDLEESRIPSWLLVIDTEGIGVECAVAGGDLNVDAIKEHIEKYKVNEKVKHHGIIIPGLAARLQGELEDSANKVVIVGPRDCGGIPFLLEKRWNLEKIEELWQEMQS